MARTQSQVPDRVSGVWEETGGLLAQAAADPNAALAALLGDRSNALSMLGRTEEALAAGQDGAALAAEVGYAKALARAHGRALPLLAKLWRREEVEALAEEALSRAEEAMGPTIGEPFVRFNVALCGYHLGERAGLAGGAETPAACPKTLGASTTGARSASRSTARKTSSRATT